MKHCSNNCGKHRDRPGQGYCRSCHAKYIKRWRANSAAVRHKERVHHKVRAAIRDGRLKRQPCQVCGAENTEAHHPDYSKPLEVIWLCVPHHGAEHKRIREIEDGEPLQATG